jgi:membrane-anchored glycerophosphoryl diester phosphodiesterase (GDPDase)
MMIGRVLWLDNSSTCFGLVFELEEQLCIYFLPRALLQTCSLFLFCDVRNKRKKEKRRILFFINDLFKIILVFGTIRYYTSLIGTLMMRKKNTKED